MVKVKEVLHGALQAWPRLRDLLLEWSIAVITIPYYLLYDRNTKSRIVAIAQARNDDVALNLLQKWLDTKNKEAQYVQVASAVIFASAISTLSWTDLTGRHWTGPACWYTSIIFSMTAVLSGAQQTMLLDSAGKVSVQTMKAHLCGTTGRPNWKYVFAWQSPLMFLGYSLVFYVTGLTSYIVSPVARDLIWDDNAKTLLFYVITAAAALAVFAMSSRLVHQTLPETSAIDGVYHHEGAEPVRLTLFNP